MHASSVPEVEKPPENPNDISISDAETQSGDGHEPSNNGNDDVYIDAQPSNENDVEIEPTVDLDNPQPENKIYEKRDCGFKSLCPFHLSQLKRMMMKNLNALLKCRGQSFCVLA